MRSTPSAVLTQRRAHPPFSFFSISYLYLCLPGTYRSELLHRLDAQCGDRAIGRAYARTSRSVWRRVAYRLVYGLAASHLNGIGSQQGTLAPFACLLPLTSDNPPPGAHLLPPAVRASRVGPRYVTTCMVQSQRTKSHPKPELGTWVLGAWCLVPGAWCLALHASCHTPRASCLMRELGVPCRCTSASHTGSSRS